MGLDMYAFIVDADKVGDKVTDVALGDDATEICYWRKFNALHVIVYWLENGLGASCVMCPVQMQQPVSSRRQWYLWQVGQWFGGVTFSRALAARSMSAWRMLRTVGLPSARAGSPRASTAAG